tara:strand:- start:841 stop:945 length:105 start_codon:yes stop_codon:yes gene_type:complete
LAKAAFALDEDAFGRATGKVVPLVHCLMAGHLSL